MVKKLSCMLDHANTTIQLAALIRFKSMKRFESKKQSEKITIHPNLSRCSKVLPCSTSPSTWNMMPNYSDLWFSIFNFVSWLEFIGGQWLRLNKYYNQSSGKSQSKRLVCLYTVLLHFLLCHREAFTSKVITHLLHLRTSEKKVEKQALGLMA